MTLSTLLYIKELIEEDLRIAKEIMDLDYEKYSKSVSHGCPKDEIERNKDCYMKSQNNHSKILEHKRSFESGIVLS